ncbi:MAG: HAD hydrolase-like protein, partial [Pseudomonadales bacterium]|nr:HAD hydrolase-like protein [Pseudomonadales bacterium]
MDIDWSSIDIVMLDMDGTLLDLAFDNRFWLQRVPQVYAELHGLSLEDSLQQLRQRFNALQGQLAWYCLDFWSQELGIDLAQLKQEEKQHISLRPGSLDFLQRLHISGHACWLVTNAHHHSLALKLDMTGIGSYFQHIVCSHSYAEPKETAAFWMALQKHHPHTPA